MTLALLVGDLHLRSDGDRRPADALVRLLAHEPDAAVVFAGDTLDLAAENAGEARSTTRILREFPAVSRALAERASRGVTTTFLAGNHDSAVASPEVLSAIHASLGLSSTDRLQVRASPWFTRVGARDRGNGVEVHVEHGHVFDPDGAPAHPLAPTARDDVGIRMLKRFIIPVGGHELVHANAERPIKLLGRVLRLYGARAPQVIAKYILAALRTASESGHRFPLESDRREGKKRLESFAAEVELDRETLDRLIDAHATPTMARLTSAVLRLYLDRVSACGAMAVGSAVSLLGAPPIGIPIAAFGALTLAISLLAGVDRYGGRASERLALGAKWTAALTGAKRVVMAHVHVAQHEGNYRNTGSFAFAPEGRRPFVRVADDGELSGEFA